MSAQPGVVGTPMEERLKPFLKRNRPGRPSLVSPEIAEEIVKHLLNGAYWEPACEAAGVSYDCVRQWIRKAQRDLEAGDLESEYVKFADTFARATAASEVGHVKKLAESDDWRAQAFLMERRWRDRWGKDDPKQAGMNITLVLGDKQQEIMLELLRLGTAKQLEIDTTATTENTEE